MRSPKIKNDLTRHVTTSCALLNCYYGKLSILMLLNSPLINHKQAILICCSLISILLLDAYSPLYGQIIASILAWWVLLNIAAKKTLAQRWILWWCLIYACLGEGFFTLVWGLYEYRLSNIPPYVPAGHVLLFLLGTYLSQYVKPLMIQILIGVSGLYVMAAFILGFDQLSLFLYLFFIACLFTQGDRRLFTTMLLLALLLELIGTALGNWQWQADVPYWHISAHNPPLISGALYCLLDLLVLISLKSHTKDNTYA
jgi:hypothetical protein